jgi:hypothetical protein
MPVGAPTKGPAILEAPQGAAPLQVAPQPQKGPPLQESADDKSGVTTEKQGPIIHEGGPLPWEGGGGDFITGGDCGSGGDCNAGGDFCCDGGACCDGACCCPTECCPSEHFWMRAEYLLWTIKNNNYPALVTTGSTADTHPGALGAPGTRVLFGGSADQDEMSGGRFTAGGWLDACQCWGVEGSVFALGERSVRFSEQSTGTPLLARPFQNVTNPAAPFQDAELVANPAFNNFQALQGRVSVDSKSQLWGAELNGIMNLGRDCNGRLDLLAGARYLDLKESVSIREDLLVSSPMTTTSLAVPGTTSTVIDSFATRNFFYGPQFGLRDEWCWGRWKLDVTGKIALGVSHETVDINGNTFATAPVLTNGTPTSAATSNMTGGLLALGSNIGHQSHNRFAAIPELGVNVSYQITDHWRAVVGYTFLYDSNVVRPGDQINTNVNKNLIPPPTPSQPAQPAPTNNHSDFWAQGGSVGLEFRY